MSAAGNFRHHLVYIKAADKSIFLAAQEQLALRGLKKHGIFIGLNVCHIFYADQIHVLYCPHPNVYQQMSVRLIISVAFSVFVL